MAIKGIADEKIWKQAIKDFGKVPKSAKDYAQVTQLYLKLGGKIKHEDFSTELNSFKESINIDIEVGDTVLGGKFKNKKIVVKDISENERGEPTINGKDILKIRLTGKEKMEMTIQERLDRLLDNKEGYVKIGKDKVEVGKIKRKSGNTWQTKISKDNGKYKKGDDLEFDIDNYYESIKSRLDRLMR